MTQSHRSASLGGSAGRTPSSTRPDPLSTLCRKMIFSQLDHMQGGCLEVRWGVECRSFGDPASDRRVHATINDPAFWPAAASGSIGLGEAYMNGLWEVDDLTTLIALAASNERLASTYDFRWARLIEPARRVLYWLERNTRAGSRRNIARHYDLGNDLFRLFLDPTMMYSCGVFPTEHSSMQEASVAKLDLICRKAELRPEHHVLEIGTGWGGFAMHAARHYGCRVTTTTISREQYDLARERIREAGLEDRIEVLLRDYRDLTGQYDRLVSIEMIEAVGHRYLESFFRLCSERLKDDGIFVLQAITIRDQEYAKARKTVDFIKRHVFPGSCLPSLEVMNRCISRATDFSVTHVEDIGLHYATTLRRWREEFHRNADAIRALGYDERFMRMWHFYLCYCEAGFLERRISDVHLVAHKPAARTAWPTLAEAAAPWQPQPQLTGTPH